MDIDVRIGEVQFAVRVAAVVIHKGHVLLHNSDADDLWVLPGGRMRAAETSAQALQREMMEEISTEVTVGQLQWVVENHFEYDGRHWHEIGLYHLAQLQDPSWYDLTHDYRGMEGETLGLTYRWVPIEKAGELNVVPRFLPAALKELPGPTRHVLNKEF